MQWTDRFSVGNDKIDQQHKKLFSTLEDLLAACKEHKAADEITNTLNFLAEYVVKHFNDEEKYMESIGYPDLENHKAIHKKFVNEVTDIINDVKAGGVSLTTIISVNQKLNDWVVSHIMKTDMLYSKYK